MHLVRTSSFLLGVLLIIAILCSHTVYYAATSDQHQCQCCCSVPKQNYMTDYQRGCWNNVNTSENTTVEISVYFTNVQRVGEFFLVKKFGTQVV